MTIYQDFGGIMLVQKELFGQSTVFISKIDGRSRKNLSRYLKDL